MPTRQHFRKFLLLLVGTWTIVSYCQDTKFSLVISTPKPEVRLGDAIPLHVIMTNTSDHDIHYAQILGARRLAVGVRILDQQGQLVPQTTYGKEMSGVLPRGNHPIGGSAFAATLTPGESVSADVMLNEEYEINRKGTYRIQAERMEPDGTRVTSNQILVKVQ